MTQTFIKIRNFSNTQLTAGKTVGIGISINWELLLSENTGQEDPGLKIKCNEQEFSHESYIKALADLISAHQFNEIYFCLAGTLQLSNLLDAWNKDFLDNEAVNLALDQLYELELRWISKYKPILENLLPNENIRYVHWNTIKTNVNFDEIKNQFVALRNTDEKIKTTFNNELNSFINRKNREGKLSPRKKFVEFYLDEEITVIADILLKNQLDYFVYTSNMSSVQQKAKRLEEKRGEWITAKISNIEISQLSNFFGLDGEVSLTPEYGIECGRKQVRKQKVQSPPSPSRFIIATPPCLFNTENIQNFEKEKVEQVLIKLMKMKKALENIEMFASSLLNPNVEITLAATGLMLQTNGLTLELAEINTALAQISNNRLVYSLKKLETLENEKNGTIFEFSL